MTDAKVYTGAVLFRDHPDVFKAVASAYFLDRLSIRAIAARYRVSVNTVRAIRDMAVESATTDQGRAAFFVKSRASTVQGIIRLKALEAIQDRLDDPEAVAELSVDTLARLSAIDNTDSCDCEKPVKASAEIIDLNEFDDLVNGLPGEKKSARARSVDCAIGDGVQAGGDGVQAGGDGVEGSDDGFEGSADGESGRADS